MADASRVRAPEASLYRLSLYHCFLLDLVRSDWQGMVTSRLFADSLRIKDETVRRDLSFVGGVGRPGVGYEPAALLDAIQNYLCISSSYPVVVVGPLVVLSALNVIFPAEKYGLRPAAYYSEDPGDAGLEFEGHVIHSITDLSDLDRKSGIGVALVATSPSWVNLALEQLHKAGVSAAVVLTQTLQLKIPEDMEVVHFRMPCDVKTLACQSANRHVKGRA